MARTTVASDKILDGTLVNADIDAAAAIAGTKISPNFGAQDLVVNTSDLFVDHVNHQAAIGTASPQSGNVLTVQGSSALRTAGTSDLGLALMDGSRNWKLGINVAGSSGSGIFSVYDTTGSAHRLVIDTSGRIGVGTAGPNTSALLELSSTSMGFLPPRMTAAQRGAIASPATGLQVYQTDGTAGYYYYNGSAWALVGVPGGSNTAVQFNDSGVLGGDATNFSWDNTVNKLLTAKNLSIPGYVGLGSQAPSSGSNRIIMPDGDRVQWASGANIAGSATNTVINTATSSAGGLLVNFSANSGTGGFIVYGGGTTPLAKFRVDPAGTNSYILGQFGVGTNAPAASALLDVSSTTQGFLAPRMTTTQKNAIASPATGLLVWDTSLGSYSVYNGSTWTSVGGGQQLKYNGSLMPAETYLNFTGNGVTVTDTPGSTETTVAIAGGVQTRQAFIATGGQTAFTLSVAYTTGGINLQVYRNGVLQKMGASYDYVETSTTVVTFNNGLTAGESIEFLYVPLSGNILATSPGTEHRQAFVATGGSQQFTLSSAYLNNGSNLRVFVNGMLQKPSTNYSEDNTTQFTIASGLIAGDTVEAIWVTAANGVVSYTPCTEVRQEFVGDGSTTTFSLTGGATFVQGGTNLRVYVDGLLQRLGSLNDYTEPSNSQVTFTSAPASGQTITLTALTQAGALGVVRNQRSEYVATSGQTTFNVGFTFVMGGADMLVYNDGVLMKLGEDYYELNNATVVFYTGRLSGSKVTFVGETQLAAGDANSVNGIAASATPTANKLLPLDTSAQVPGAAIQRAMQMAMIFGR